MSLTATIKGRPAPEAAHLFAPNMAQIDEVFWETSNDEAGRYWTAMSDDGVAWVSDGFSRIAALPARMLQFYRHGIAQRCERLTNRYLKDLIPIRPGDIVVNFGANVGEVATTLARRGASVLAIEPDPNVLPALRANSYGLGIEIAPVAAWRHDGELEMFIASDTADTSAFNVSADRRVLPCCRIDTLVGGYGVENVRLIAGDAEGGEPEVLQGASRILSTTDYVSIAASAERCGETTVDACEALLTESGFDIVYKEDRKFCMIIGKSRRLLNDRCL